MSSMKFLFQDKANEAGIYRIMNLTNGRVYIGSTYRFKHRAKGHHNDLLVGRHLNTFLQNDFNKCGSDALVFEVIEVVQGDKAARLQREQHFLDQFYDDQKQCYNLVPKAMDSRGGTRNKGVVDRTTDGRCKTPSQEVLIKRSEGLKKAFQDPELRAECSRRAKEVRWKGHSVNLVVVHKATGESVTIQGSLRQWCADRNLSYKAFHQLTQGKIKSSGGWTLA